MFQIRTLNNISARGLERLPRDQYEVASEINRPDAILVRSANMHEMELPETLKAIGRAGAGVNNIPVDAMSQRGVPVFNAPGANANAVKELVLAAMLMGARNIPQAWEYTRNLQESGEALTKAVEDGKKQFAGFELPGRTLGVVGLGAIGRAIADAALALGMRVIGYDPGITVEGAWQLSAEVERAPNVDALFAKSEFVTFHVPLVDATRHILNAERVKTLPKGAVVLNFARHGIVDDHAVMESLDSGHLGAYLCDFPSETNRHHPKVVALPHLGASTGEAEDNSAMMVADQVRDYLEDGNVRNSVNFPETVMERVEGAYRVAVVNSNVPNILGQVSTDFADAGLNIIDMINKSRGDLAYTLVDVDQPVPESALEAIRETPGVLSVRIL